ncbi:hypothetical protein [Paenibacillus polymyxa]|uniref:Uncharacterized protein n=1 Tax=Paenibacillus polymyxa (strain SC2) TaxID=886882 RepID=E3EK91_PAEPS|nr:hypothetical protein [Paenibacillus polymyxa]ADO59418.1 hypothetical protein PPSC2_27965 [Paenibacillus polymyxa SC2]WPQ59741.1 hypothetical protein SKN87_25980 [Paenibacillus polymyxa]
MGELIAPVLIIFNLSGVAIFVAILFRAYEKGHVGTIAFSAVGFVVNLLAVIVLTESHYDQLIKLSFT